MQGAMQPPPYVPFGPGFPPVATPVPSMVTAVVPQHEVGLKPRQRRAMTILSGLQIVIGISCATIYIVLIAINRKSNNYYNGGYLDMVGAGIWCGGLYIIAGSLGVAAARRNRLCLMVSAMVFCILSSLVIWVVIGFAAAAIDTTNRDERTCSSYTSGGLYYYYYYHVCYVFSFSGLKTADSLLIILSGIELVISIWCSVLCCKGSCKACCRSCCYNETQIIYAPVHFDGERVMFIQQSAVAGGQALSVLPSQSFFVDMQHPVHAAHPAVAPPGYQPAVVGLPQYSATYNGNVATSGATCGQPGEITKDALALGQ